jgi:SpoIID/LytB domain protein
VNVLGIDAYVSGVVPLEVPSSWEPAALRAQSVAARSYAAWHRTQYRDRYYHICDTTSCQVYGGVAAEQPTTDGAVEATSREVLTYDGKPALTQFSSSSGGWTVDGGLPYLKARKDTFDSFSGNPMHTWTVSIPAATVERGHPALGRYVGLRVVRRDGHGDWNGRVEKLRLIGTKGTVALSGDDMRLRYGLLSSWFRVRPS